MAPSMFPSLAAEGRRPHTRRSWPHHRAGLAGQGGRAASHRQHGQNATNSATVGGDVNSPKPVPLSLRGERLLDVVAQAGGARYPAYETYAEIVRGGQQAWRCCNRWSGIRPRTSSFARTTKMFLTLVFRGPSPSWAPRRKSPNIRSILKRVSLAEALARAGGPIDTIGDPGGIYLFRFEPWPLAKEILHAQNIDLGDGPHPDFVPILTRSACRGRKVISMRSRSRCVTRTSSWSPMRKRPSCRNCWSLLAESPVSPPICSAPKSSSISRPHGPTPSLRSLAVRRSQSLERVSSLLQLVTGLP